MSRGHSEGARELEEEEPLKETQSGCRGRRLTVRVERHTNPKKDV